MVKLKPEYWAGHNSLGILLSRLGRHAEAAQQFRHVTELAPDYPWGYTNLGAQYQALKRNDEAISWYRQATVKGGEVEARARAFFNMGTVYYGEDHFSQAVRSLKEGLRLQETHMMGWHMLGNTYACLEQHTDARVA